MNKANNMVMVRMMDVLGVPLEYFVDDSNQRLTFKEIEHCLFRSSMGCLT